jgi:hypothetical protein
MTDLTEIRRAAFEAQYPVPDDVYWGAHVNTYCASGVADSYSCNYWMMWDCWKAALDSVVVELPPKFEDVTGLFSYDADEVVLRLKASGIKTK